MKNHEIDAYFDLLRDVLRNPKAYKTEKDKSEVLAEAGVSLLQRLCNDINTIAQSLETLAKIEIARRRDEEK